MQCQVFLSEVLNSHCVCALLGIYSTYWSSAVVAYPLRGLLCCVFRDALLHTTVVMCGYLNYCHLPVSFDQSGPSPLTSLINKHFCPPELLLTGCFLFFASFSANSRDCCVWKSQEISSFWDTQTTLSGTNNHSHDQSHLDHISSPFWHLVWKNSWTSWPGLHAIMHLVLIGWWNICINKLVYRST